MLWQRDLFRPNGATITVCRLLIVRLCRWMPVRALTAAVLWPTLLSATGHLNAAGPSQLVPVDGQPFSAAITSIDSDGTLHLLTDGKTSTIGRDQVVRWGGFVDARRGPQVLLAGDGLIVADEVQIDGERLVASSAVFGNLKLPLESVV